LLVAGGGSAAAIACVGDDPVTPPTANDGGGGNTTIIIVSPDGGGASVIDPSVIPEESDGGDLPEASTRDCFDNLPHDFCSTFGFDADEAALKAAGFYAVERTAPSSVSKSPSIAVSPPASLRVELAPVPSPSSPQQLARISKAATWPVTVDGKQPRLALSTRVYFDRVSTARVAFLNVAIALERRAPDPPKLDYVLIVAHGDPANPENVLLELAEWDLIRTAQPVEVHLTPLPGLSFRRGQWADLKLDITERSTTNPGGATVSVGPQSAPLVKLFSKATSTTLITWFGGSTYESGGQGWAIHYDDLAMDWTPPKL